MNVSWKATRAQLDLGVCSDGVLQEGRWGRWPPESSAPCASVSPGLGDSARSPSRAVPGPHTHFLKLTVIYSTSFSIQVPNANFKVSEQLFYDTALFHTVTPLSGSTPSCLQSKFPGRRRWGGATVLTGGCASISKLPEGPEHGDWGCWAWSQPTSLDWLSALNLAVLRPLTSHFNLPELLSSHL